MPHVAAAFSTVLLTAAFACAWPLLGRLDNELGDGMTADPQPDLCARVRHWLGLDHIHEHLRRQEIEMAKVIDLLNGLIAQNTAASAAQATSFHNIDVSFKNLQDAIANGDASPEVQAAADQLAAGFASLQKAAEDEGRLYQPADDNGGQPVVTPPADGGDTPPVDNGGDTPIVDGGDSTDAPVVDKTKR